MRLSLLRAPTYPDPLADRGYHDFKYALYPHQGDFYQGRVVRQGFEFNEPLRVFRTSLHKGSLAKTHSFIQVEPDNIILNALKKSEDDQDWIVRLYETAGKACQAVVRFDRTLTGVTEVNLIEDKLDTIKSGDKEFRFDMKPNEIRTFKVKMFN